MTGQLTSMPDPETDARWRQWQARGAEADRRRATAIGRLSAIAAVGLAIWLFIQLA